MSTAASAVSANNYRDIYPAANEPTALPPLAINLIEADDKSEDGTPQFTQASRFSSGYASQRGFDHGALLAFALQQHGQRQEGAVAAHGGRTIGVAGAGRATAARNLPQQPTTNAPQQHTGDLPNMGNRTEAERYDYYSQLARDRGVAVDATPGKRTLLGLRVSTNTTAQGTGSAGQGVYDDRLVVLWTERDRDGNTVKHVKEIEEFNKGVGNEIINHYDFSAPCEPL